MGREVGVAASRNGIEAASRRGAEHCRSRGESARRRAVGGSRKGEQPNRLLLCVARSRGCGETSLSWQAAAAQVSDRARLGLPFPAHASRVATLLPIPSTEAPSRLPVASSQAADAVAKHSPPSHHHHGGSVARKSRALVEWSTTVADPNTTASRKSPRGCRLGYVPVALLFLLLLSFSFFFWKGEWQEFPWFICVHLHAQRDTSIGWGRLRPPRRDAVTDSGRNKKRKARVHVHEVRETAGQGGLGARKHTGREGEDDRERRGA